MIEVEKENDGKFLFKLKSKSGNVLLNSVKCSNEKELKTKINDLISLESRPNKFERKTNHEGEFLFSIKNKNGDLIGNSMGYTSEAGMENGIKNLQNRITLFSNKEEL